MKIINEKTTYSDSGFPVFMLMAYDTDYESGMDGFYPYGKFFGDPGDTVESLNKELDQMKKDGKVPEDYKSKSSASSTYVSEYNEYFDDPEDEVYQNLETLVSRTFTPPGEWSEYYDDLPFESLKLNEGIKVYDVDEYNKGTQFVTVKVPGYDKQYEAKVYDGEVEYWSEENEDGEFEMMDYTPSYLKAVEIDVIDYLYDNHYIVDESLTEDTVKKANGKWTNRGDDGTEHGEFDTKAEADAQRKAMFARGYKG